MKKPPPQQDDDEEEDRKPAARRTDNDDSYQTHPTDQSVGSNASHSTAARTPLMVTTAKGESLGHEPLHLATIVEEHAATGPPIATQVAVLGGTSALSFVMFILMMIPMEALAALCLAIASLVLLGFQLYQHARRGLQDAVNGRGIGDYLPSWLFSMLVEDSIHEQMLDDSFALEWRHMALYMMPGLSRQQIDAFVDRLPRRHRDFLLRPGVGHVLGHDFMQLILGRERFPEHAMVEPAANATAADVLPPPMPNNPRRLDFVPNSNNATAATGDDDSIALSDYDAPSSPNENGESVARALVLRHEAPPPFVAARAVPEQEDEEIDYDGEYAVLVEAFFSGMNSMVLTPALDMTLQVMDSVSGLFTSPTVSMALVSGSMGVFSYWRGLWGRNGVRPQTTWRDGDIWSTAVLGTGVAGVLLYMRANRRSRTDRKK